MTSGRSKDVSSNESGFKPTRFLVIADSDDTKQRAVRAAIELLEENAGEVIVVAFVFDPAAEKGSQLKAPAAAELKARLQRDKREWLDKTLSRVDVGQVRLTSEIVWAKDPVQWVCEAAVRRDVDLVIKAWRGSAGVLRTPTDWHLLRRSPVPVMIVSRRLKKKSGRILVTVDLGSKDVPQQRLNRRVLATGMQIARRLDQEVSAVYAIPISTVAMDLEYVDTMALESAVRKRLAKGIAAIEEEFGIPADRIRIKAGPPERVIAGTAIKLKANLVVMGTIGRAGIKGRLLGNTAEQVLHRVRANVLALRPDHPDQ